MAKRYDVYRCNLCGHIVEVVNKGEGTLVCCGQEMAFLSENTEDAAVEKHVPVIEITDDGVTVKVGAVPHPMTEEHYIPWIEVISDGKLSRVWLNPGDAPEASFKVNGGTISARAYCNLHGHWKSS